MCLILHYGKQNRQEAKSQVQVVLTKGLLFSGGDGTSGAWLQTQWINSVHWEWVSREASQEANKDSLKKLVLSFHQMKSRVQT